MSHPNLQKEQMVQSCFLTYLTNYMLLFCEKISQKT